MSASLDPARLLETLKRLIAYPSPQPDIEKVRAFIQESVRPELPEDDFDSVFQDAGGSVGWWMQGGSGDESPLVLCGYAGNFPAESMPDPYGPKEVDGDSYGQDGPCMWGRGTCEQIGALASAIEAVRTFVAGRPDSMRRSLLFLVNTAGETGSHEAVSGFFDEAASVGVGPGDAVILMGTNNEVCLGNKGRVDVPIEITGKACHSSTPDLGVNALEALAVCIDRLKDLKLPPADPDLGPVTLVATGAETFPKASHTIPERVLGMLDRRLLPGEEPELVVEAIREVLGGLSPAGLEVRSGKFQYANKVSASASLPSAADAAVHSRRGASHPFYMNAALDAGYFYVRGHQAVCLGPGDMTLAHTDAEMVRIQDVIDGAGIYLNILKRLL